MFSQPSFSLELDFDVPIDNFEICDSNVDMGNKDNVLNMLGENGMMPPLIHIAYT